MTEFRICNCLLSPSHFCHKLYLLIPQLSPLYNGDLVSNNVRVHCTNILQLIKYKRIED